MFLATLKPNNLIYLLSFFQQIVEIMTRFALLQARLVIWAMPELTVIMTIYTFAEARQVIEIFQSRVT